jgi:hypothetical protein
MLVILTSICNSFFDIKDTMLLPESNELILKSSSNVKIKFDTNGGFKIFNNDNSGILCDSSGNITIYGAAINNLKVDGTTSTDGEHPHNHTVQLAVELTNTSTRGDL